MGSAAHRSGVCNRDGLRDRPHEKSRVPRHLGGARSHYDDRNPSRSPAPIAVGRQCACCSPGSLCPRRVKACPTDSCSVWRLRANHGAFHDVLLPSRRSAHACCCRSLLITGDCVCCTDVLPSAAQSSACPGSRAGCLDQARSERHYRPRFRQRRLVIDQQRRRRCGQDGIMYLWCAIERAGTQDTWPSDSSSDQRPGRSWKGPERPAGAAGSGARD